MTYTPEQQAQWDQVMDYLRQDMGNISYNTWFKSLKYRGTSGNTLYITSDNAFALRHIQNRYLSLLLSAMDSVFGQRYDPEFHTPEEMAEIEKKLTATTLNAKYTFDNFVVGAGNTFAHAAAVAVAESFSESYNPLFIYGGVGLGKTHLMNAVGNFVLSRDPGKNVLLITSETMANELIAGIAKKNTSELRQKLRTVDYLMVDDIQFLAKTRATQEEFFNTFNDLRENHKQIVISSDRPPKEIPEIDERLRSRFEWGLIVDIQKPDYETRVAILRQKAMDDHIDVPDDVLEYIARNVNTNIRALEGSLAGLNARSQLMHSPINLEMAKASLLSLVQAREDRRLTCELIIDVVAESYGMAAADLTGKRRSAEIALARQVAMYVCREMTEFSTTAIGKSFGRDHTTILHGIEKIESGMKADYGLRKRVDEIMRAVRDE